MKKKHSASNSETKLTLDMGALENDFFYETSLLGITASVKNYRFCWMLNNMLGYHFRLNPDIEITVCKKERIYFFPLYQYCENNSILLHYLYHNQYDGEYLLPEFKHMDFLWMMKGTLISDEECTAIMKCLKTIPEVQMVTKLSIEKIKNKGNLVF